MTLDIKQLLTFKRGNMKQDNYRTLHPIFLHSLYTELLVVCTDIFY